MPHFQNPACLPLFFFMHFFKALLVWDFCWTIGYAEPAAAMDSAQRCWLRLTVPISSLCIHQRFVLYYQSVLHSGALFMMRACTDYYK